MNRRSGENSFDVDNDASKYFKAAADSHIFKKGMDVEHLLWELTDVADVFRMALRFEKDSVVLYQGMKSMVPEGLGRAEIDRNN